jgi:Asp-tRNA(Asn)/Glu-tRNA(Gln) amidotransferase A subunit family amidase
LHYLTIEEAAKLLRTRQLSSFELVSIHLQRIEALDPKLHVFITLTAEAALEEARQADSEISAGRYRGPLHGIPIAHKDLVQTRGTRTTAHSNLLRLGARGGCRCLRASEAGGGDLPREDGAARVRLWLSG